MRQNKRDSPLLGFIVGVELGVCIILAAIYTYYVHLTN